MTRIGGLFAGYGGLEMGVQAALGGTVAWHSEIDPDASRILAHHWPDVPNLGDITNVDWSQVEPVDIITGGSPCQDVSSAGKRQGMRAGTRSGLWASMVDAIDVLRPRLVVWENVRGVLSAEADSAMEPCPGCVGGPDDGPVLRALGRVLGDLCELGYDAQWHGLRAADVGAPHGRFRIFVVARDAAMLGRDDAQPAGTGGDRQSAWATGGSGSTSTADSDRDAVRQQPVTEPRAGSAALAGLPGADAAADAPRPGRQGSRPEPARRGPERGGGAAADTERGRRDGQTPEARRCALHGTPTARCGPVSRGDVFAGRWCACERPAADADRTTGRQQQPEGVTPGPAEGTLLEAGRRAGRDSGAHPETQWGEYEPAVRRWERVLCRVAPAPTELGAKGGQRLSPRFVEWMMGLPEGHVTDPAIGISRNAQLKALGNGVVPAQAAAAVRFLLNVAERAA